MNKKPEKIEEELWKVNKELKEHFSKYSPESPAFDEKSWQEKLNELHERKKRIYEWKRTILLIPAEEEWLKERAEDMKYALKWFGCEIKDITEYKENDGSRILSAVVVKYEDEESLKKALEALLHESTRTLWRAEKMKVIR